MEAQAGMNAMHPHDVRAERFQSWKADDNAFSRIGGFDQLDPAPTRGEVERRELEAQATGLAYRDLTGDGDSTVLALAVRVRLTRRLSVGHGCDCRREEPPDMRLDLRPGQRRDGPRSDAPETALGDSALQMHCITARLTAFAPSPSRRTWRRAPRSETTMK